MFVNKALCAFFVCCSVALPFERSQLQGVIDIVYYPSYKIIFLFVTSPKLSNCRTRIYVF